MLGMGLGSGSFRIKTLCLAVEPSLRLRLLDFGAAVLEGEGIFVPFSDDATPPGEVLEMAAAKTVEPLSPDPLATLAAKLLLDLDMAQSLRSGGVSLPPRLFHLSDSAFASEMRSGSEGLRS